MNQETMELKLMANVAEARLEQLKQRRRDIKLAARDKQIADLLKKLAERDAKIEELRHNLELWTNLAERD
jgi:predicted RNase H-like nuclease (RuvC/YqgF family)